jgi:nucleotide-binding universal stress UspA family protein
MAERIVVGVDGSEGSKWATRWAAREAKLRRARIELITAWELPIYAESFAMGTVPDELVEELEQNAKKKLVAAAEEARAEGGELDIETRATEGQPATVLLQAAKNADLLVVGSRGLGGFSELLLGSVSHQCAHHATCPVVIVRQLR